jgi:tetratricopeptide (TPR) repeat protein
MRLYEEVRQERKTALTPREQWSLAELYDKSARWKQARTEMEKLLAVDPDNAAMLASYVRMLIRHNERSADIQPWVDKLEAVQPDTPLTIGVKARFLVHQRRDAEAVKLLRGLIPDPVPRENLGILRDVAGLLEELRQPGPAEELLHEYARRASGGSLALAGLLGRQGKLAEALDQCEAALKEVPLTTVIPAAISILHAQQGNLPDEQLGRVDAWLDQALTEAPNSKEFHLQQSELRHLQGRYDELPGLYRAFLERDDTTSREKALIWNNLAFVLAASGADPKEADALVAKAIGVLGPSAELLDTRAVVHLANGRPEEAIDDLKVALADSPSGVVYFHLAMAQDAAGDRQGATESLRAAMTTYRLTEAQVPAIERPKFRKLVGSLKVAQR